MGAKNSGPQEGGYVVSTSSLGKPASESDAPREIKNRTDTYDRKTVKEKGLKRGGWAKSGTRRKKSVRVRKTKAIRELFVPLPETKG